MLSESQYELYFFFLFYESRNRMPQRKSRRGNRNPNKRSRRIRRRRALQKGGGSAGSPTIDLVIARYREDLDWLKDYAELPFHRIFLYNKSSEAVACPPIQGQCIERQLENVGMCDHTYLHHMIENYDDLADITIFLPASGDLPNKKARTEFVIRKTFAEGHPVMTGFLRDNPVHQDLHDFSLDSWKVTDKDNRTRGGSTNLYPADVRPFGVWYETYLPGVETKLEQNAGIFSVGRDSIRGNPRDFYQTFLDQLAKDKQPEVAHYMERAWPGILGFPRKWFYDVNEYKLM